MKKLALTVAVSTATIMLSQAAHADRVKGSARADFENDTLSVPCVEIAGFNENADGQYFDIILLRRGNSFNYELTFAEAEDQQMCDEAANYAAFIDDDDDDEDDDIDDDDDDLDDDDDDDDIADGDDDDDDEDGDDDPVDVAALFASCEIRLEGGEQTRSKVKVKARDLLAGEYYAVVMSGENSIDSEVRSISDDEAEFEFSSSADDPDEEGIEATFIQGESVTAQFFDANAAEGADPLFEETVSCLVREKD